jgi:hypothetical protein
MVAGMSESHASTALSRRALLRYAAASAAVVGGGVPWPALAADGGAGGRGNVRVSHDQFTIHAEPSLAANPADPRNLLGGCMVGPAGSPQFIATYVSFDGGAAWRSNGALPLPAGTAVADDVTVAFDRAGRGFVCAMVTSGLSRRDDRGVYVWRTEDGGRSFAPPAAVMSGQFADHPWLAADRSHGPGSGNLYAVWVAEDQGGLGFSRSTDGGRSFEPPRLIQGQGDTSVSMPMVAAGPDGLVSAVYEGPFQRNGLPDEIYAVEVVCSTDGGRSFGAPVTLGEEAAVISLPGNVQPVSGPAVAAAPRGDAVVAAFTTHHPGAGHSDIVIAASLDRGRTWSAPVPVTPADQVTYFQPQLAVDDAGRIALSAFALAGDRVDVVLFTSVPNTLRFGPPLRVTSRPFDPARGTPSGGKHGAWWIGDYQGLAITPGAIHPFWNDTRTGQLELFTTTIRRD